MINLISKEQAKASGLSRYYTGIPCKNGHLSERSVHSGSCITCRKNNSINSLKKNPDIAKRHKTKKREIYNHSSKQWREEKLSKHPWYHILTGAKCRAKDRGLQFDLTEEWCIKNWTGKCQLSGIEFDLRRLGKRYTGYSPSIDRIDNSKGYITTNCRFILQSLNAMKGVSTDEDMLGIMKRVLENV